MTISARIIADSCQQSLWEGHVPDNYNRLTTFVLRYPRFIHAEFMTHRVFSRNAASSRAIPVQKMIDAVLADPAMPVFWGKNQAGMQAAEELSDDIVTDPVPGLPDLASWRMSPRSEAKRVWLEARNLAVGSVLQLTELGLHKQIANRILEPWSHIEVVATATDFSNFYALRNHPMAQPEFQELARKMFEAHKASKPIRLAPGQWHLPFVRPEEVRDVEEGLIGDHRHLDDPFFLPKISAARCARVSYLKHDGTESNYPEDLGLYDRLMGGNPKHASPTEHQARCPNEGDYWPAEYDDDLKYPSNLHGWVQFRKLIEGENISRHEGFVR